MYLSYMTINLKTNVVAIYYFQLATKIYLFLFAKTQPIFFQIDTSGLHMTRNILQKVFFSIANVLTFVKGMYLFSLEKDNGTLQISLGLVLKVSNMQCKRLKNLRTVK